MRGDVLEQQELMAALSKADELRPAVLAARQALRAAKSSSRGAGNEEKGRQNLLQQACGRLAELESGRGARLASVGKATVYEFWIEVPGYSGPVHGATARVTQRGDVHQVSDVQGKTKGGLGGAVVGGALLGVPGAVVGAVVSRKTKVQTTVREVDTRQFELELSGPGFAWSITQGPGSASSLQSFRDKVNARGSSSEDVKALAKAQAERVEGYRADVHGAALACQSAATVVDQASLAHQRAWNEYATARLPLIAEARGRWAQSGLARRGAFVLLVPVVLIALIAWLAVTVSTGDSAGTSAALGATLLDVTAVLVLAAIYVYRVRLIGTGDKPSRAGTPGSQTDDFFKQA